MSWFYWHWQNLNDRNKYKKGNPLKNGRAWFNFGHLSFHVEWGMKLGLGASVYSNNDPEGFGIHFHLLGPYIYLSIYHPVFRPVIKKSRHIGFSFLNKGRSIHLSFLAEYFGEGGWSMLVDFPDLLFGKGRYSTRAVESFPVVIPLPEKSYEGIATISENTWKRRWPFKKRCINTWVKLTEGLPYPGKGENSWDTGEDAIMGYGCKSTVYEDVVAQGVQSCLRNRRRYAGVDWIPSGEST